MASKKKDSKDLMGALKIGKGETKAEEEALKEIRKLDPFAEIDPTEKLDFGIIDYGKCAFLKPCCKRLPSPCGCMGYLALAITFVGGMIGSIIIW